MSNILFRLQIPASNIDSSSMVYEVDYSEFGFGKNAEYFIMLNVCPDSSDEAKVFLEFSLRLGACVRNLECITFIIY